MANIPKEINDAYNKLIGAWSNVDYSIFFMFTDPEINFNRKIMTYKIKGKIVNLEYFLTSITHSSNKFALHTKVFVDRFKYGNLIIEFIDNDTLEVKYLDEETFTLMKMYSGFEKIFES